MPGISKRRSRNPGNSTPQLECRPHYDLALSVEQLSLDRGTKSIAERSDYLERKAKANAFSAQMLARAIARESWERANSICSVCGLKALYYMAGKRYCTKHISIGKAAHAKKWTARA